MPALQHFFDAERIRRGWTMRETAKRSQISVSKAYAISNGDDNVEFETFENIAMAFGMTAAELATAIGKGGPDTDPELAVQEAMLRRLPREHRSLADRFLRALLPPEDAHTPRKSRAHAAKSTLSASSSEGDDELYNPLTACFVPPHHRLSFALPRP